MGYEMAEKSIDEVYRLLQLIADAGSDEALIELLDEDDKLILGITLRDTPPSTELPSNSEKTLGLIEKLKKLPYT